MELDLAKIDAAVLALLYLGRHDGARAWKGFDWDALDRLHGAGLISDPRSKRSRSCSATRGRNGPPGCCEICSARSRDADAAA